MTAPSAMSLSRIATQIVIDRDPSAAGPLSLRHIIAIGRNYAEHAREQGAAVPELPVIFTKNPAALSLSGDDIVIPRICQDREQVDFEAELAFIIGPGPGGAPAKDVPRERWRDHVLGFTGANDVSARWWQKEGSGGQFYRGKSFDTFCPIGPIVVPTSAIDPANARIRCRVNGETMQDASTSQMLFPIDVLVAELSRGTTLVPGTVVITGTPSGVGMSRKPPVFLKDGDVVEVEIDGIGVLRNRVRAES
ncbi:MAG: fumarylacetoacetate hydrolase family protein [Phycisphaerales bacterium]|nr:fumarylacetoacetate hydrolase family protein [Phycisphaerales bacterium]